MMSNFNYMRDIIDARFYDSVEKNLSFRSNVIVPALLRLKNREQKNKVSSPPGTRFINGEYIYSNKQPESESESESEPEYEPPVKRFINGEYIYSNKQPESEPEYEPPVKRKFVVKPLTPLQLALVNKSLGKLSAKDKIHLKMHEDAMREKNAFASKEDTDFLDKLSEH